jgi:hypothetical protein
MDIRNQGHTIFASVAKAEAFIAANAHALIEGEAYRVEKNPKGESAIVMFSIDGVDEAYV